MLIVTTPFLQAKNGAEPPYWLPIKLTIEFWTFILSYPQNLFVNTFWINSIFIKCVKKGRVHTL